MNDIAKLYLLFLNKTFFSRYLKQHKETFETFSLGPPVGAEVKSLLWHYPIVFFRFFLGHSLFFSSIVAFLSILVVE